MRLLKEMKGKQIGGSFIKKTNSNIRNNQLITNPPKILIRVSIRASRLTKKVFIGRIMQAISKRIYMCTGNEKHPVVGTVEAGRGVDFPRLLSISVPILDLPLLPEHSQNVVEPTVTDGTQRESAGKGLSYKSL